VTPSAASFPVLLFDHGLIAIPLNRQVAEQIVLTVWDLPSARTAEIYFGCLSDARLSLVRSASAAEVISESGIGNVPAATVREEATRICAAVILAIIERDTILSCPELRVSTGPKQWGSFWSQDQ